MTERQNPTALDVSTLDIPLTLTEIYQNQNPCILEIGFGDGEFLIEVASEHPERNHLGIEIKTKRYKKAVKQSKHLGLQNLKFLHFDANLALNELFGEGSFEKVFINFPDPWPKEKHQKHRIINPQFLKLLYKVTSSKGVIEIASDHAEYITHILETFEEEGSFESRFPPPGYVNEIPGRQRTRFENEFREEGAEIFYLGFTKNAE